MIDHNEAPKGFKAMRAVTGCNGCHFFEEGGASARCPEGVSCMKAFRKDDTSVVFVKKSLHPALKNALIFVGGVLVGAVGLYGLICLAIAWSR